MEDDFPSAAAEFPDPFRLLIRESAGSTNDEARMLAAKGAPDGLVVLALEQTDGRGRRGAAWFAPTGESIACSIVVRPEEPKSLWPRLALATGLAVAEAAESFGLRPGIKWPNDVWISGRKVAGILVEAGQDFVIVGIGLNVNTTCFPPAVAGIATSLRIERGTAIPRHEVLAALIRRFSVRRSQIGSSFDSLIEGVRQRCVLSGREVSLSTPLGPRSGRVEGIGPGGELLFRSGSSLESLIQADEVRLLDDPESGPVRA